MDWPWVGKLDASYKYDTYSNNNNNADNVG